MPRYYWFLFDENIDIQRRRRPRLIHRRINYHLHQMVFRQSFRIDKEVFIQLENLIGRYLVNTRRNNALTPRQQILTALHFMGNGCQYHVNGQVHGISKATVFRCVRRICYLVCHYMMPLFIRWPTNDAMIERRFFELAGFPNVKGAVDGTLIHINAPTAGEPAYVGRDGKHSINVVIVSGPQNEIFFASAKSPGSFHDSRALRISNLWNSWELEHWRPGNQLFSLLILHSLLYRKTSQIRNRTGPNLPSAI